MHPSFFSRNTLERLRSLDVSSHGFHDQFNSILCGEDYRQYVQNLHSDDLVQLAGYLDTVRRRTALICSSLKSL